MFRKLPAVKKCFTILALIGFACLLAGGFFCVFKGADPAADHDTLLALRLVFLITGGAILLVCIPVLWKDGIQNAASAKRTGSHWLRMRQSGFFDLLVLLACIAALLLIFSLIGRVSYDSAFASMAEKAAEAADALVPETLEEAKKLSTFNEYNFKQALNIFSGSYSAFFTIGAIIAVLVAMCLLYMRFVTPIVRADEKLQIIHKTYRTVAQYAAAILLVIISLFPIYWMIISSFKTSAELTDAVPTLWPKEFIFSNYPSVLKKAPFLRYLVNTLVTTLAIMAGELTIGVMAAYGFSKGQFKGKNVLFLLVLGALMVPIQVTFVPIYVTLARLSLIDTWLGVILPNLVSAYFIFMLRQNFMAVDNSYIEAGKIDGMGRFGTIIHVLVPMCKPTVITVSIISFINGWNSYFWPKMITQTEKSRTIAVGVQRLKETFAGQFVSNYNEIMAGAVMAIIPIVFLFLILQKYIMTGMSKAAMK